MGKRLRTGIVIIVTVLLASYAVCGCTKDNSAGETKDSTQPSAVTSGLDVENMFTDRDKEIGYDENESTMIKLTGTSAECDSDTVLITDGTVTVTGEGVYVLSGSLGNGSIVVDAEKTDKIQLVLDGVDINCDTSAAIYVKQADKVFVTLAKSTENKLSNTKEFVAVDDNHIDAVLFSKDDLTLNGEGTLAINAAYGHGVVSKDDLVVAGGTYKVEASRHAFSGNDSVRVAGGSFTLTAGTDGIHAENTEDTSLGYIYIADGDFHMDVQSDGMDAVSAALVDGGSYEIAAADDGIHSDMSVMVRDGSINITECYEGLEGQTVEIQGGKVSIHASDDGLNAAGGNDQSSVGPGAEKDEFQADEDACIKISGGTVTIDAAGDGVDSNGGLYVSGGETYVSGPVDNANGALDYNGEGQITGGVFVAAGPSGMAQNFGSSSTQGAILAATSSQQAADSVITLSDSDGNEIFNYISPKQFNSVLVSCPQIEKGKTYTLVAGSETIHVEMTDIIYGQSSQMPGGGMGGKKDGAGQDGMKRGGSGQDGSMPEGAAPDGTHPGGTPPDGTDTDGGTPDGADPGGAPPDGAARNGTETNESSSDQTASAGKDAQGVL